MFRKWSRLTAAMLLLVAAGCGGGDQPGGPQQAGGIDTLGSSYIHAQHQGFLLIRPKQILESPVLKTLLTVVPEGEDPFGKIEEKMGIDPRTMETVVLIGGGKPEAIRDAAGKVAQGGAPDTDNKDISGCIVIHASEPLEETLKKHPGLKDHQEAKHGDATYWKSPNDSAPSLYFIDSQTVLLAADREITAYIDHPAPSGPLHELVAKTDLKHDIVGVGVMGELAKLAENPPPGVPAQGQGLLDSAKEINSGNLFIDFGSAPKLQTNIAFNQADASQKFHKQFNGFVEFGKSMALFTLPGIDFPPEIDKDAVVSLATESVNSVTLKQDGTNVTLLAATPQDFNTRLEKIMPGMIAATQRQMREVDSIIKLRMVGLPFHSYHNVHNRFPADIVAKDGTPLMSWRVELLPFLEGYEEVYKQLRRDEPWDSEHNAKLLAKMPEEFAIGVNPADGKTDMLAPSGNGAWIGSGKKLGIGDVRDGSSNTIVLVQVQPELAVPWAKPADYAFDPKDPAAGLGASADAKKVPVLFMDVSAQSLGKSLTPEQWLALFTYDGEEVIDFLERTPMAAPANFDLGDPDAAPPSPAPEPAANP